jgi:hypothetical protein
MNEILYMKFQQIFSFDIFTQSRNILLSALIIIKKTYAIHVIVIYTVFIYVDIHTKEAKWQNITCIKDNLFY